jgi:hypothetical protein
VRRFLSKFSFLAAVLLVVGFAYFTYLISKPVTSAEKDVLVRGTVRPAAVLLPDAPFIRYVALYRGKPTGSDDTGTLIDDVQTSEDGSFQLRADEDDGTQFYVLARLETAREEFWCRILELPPLRHGDERAWVEQATERPLAPVRISVGRGRCG